MATELLTTGEVLTYLRITRRTMYRLLRARSIPALRVGHKWRFRRKEIDAWMAAGGNRPKERRKVPNGQAVVRRTAQGKSGRRRRKVA